MARCGSCNGEFEGARQAACPLCGVERPRPRVAAAPVQQRQAAAAPQQAGDAAERPTFAYEQPQAEVPGYVQTPQGWVSTDPAYAGWVYTAQGWVQADPTWTAAQAQTGWDESAYAGWPQPDGGKKRRGVAIFSVLAFLVAVAGGYFVSTRLLFGGDNTLTSEDGTMSLVVSSGWKQNNNIAGQPFKIGALNNGAQQAVGAIDLPKSQLLPGATVGDVSRQVQTGVFDLMQNEQVISTSPVGTTIAGLPAVEMVFRGDYTAGVFTGNVGFIMTIFDAPDRFVAVTAWTPGERFDSGLAELRTIIASFKVNPPSSTA